MTVVIIVLATIWAIAGFVAFLNCAENENSFVRKLNIYGDILMVFACGPLLWIFGLLAAIVSACALLAEKIDLVDTLQRLLYTAEYKPAPKVKPEPPPEPVDSTKRSIKLAYEPKKKRRTWYGWPVG